MRFNVSLTAAFASLLGTTTAGTVWVTPHEQYSSSIGVPGCKINTNRVAYFPGWPGCNNLCVSVTTNGRSVDLLKVDSSQGAHDISYDAWNYLVAGQSATASPQMGGPLEAQAEVVPMARCASLLYTPDGSLPILAANGFNFAAACHSQTPITLYNIVDPVCKWGVDEVCTNDWAGDQNQPSCGSGLGSTTPMPPCLVRNVQYGSGKMVCAA